MFNSSSNTDISVLPPPKFHQESTDNTYRPYQLTECLKCVSALSLKYHIITKSYKCTVFNVLL